MDKINLDESVNFRSDLKFELKLQHIEDKLQRKLQIKLHVLFYDKLQRELLVDLETSLYDALHDKIETEL